nr:unnamed protein product [Callosobruchus analis]
MNRHFKLKHATINLQESRINNPDINDSEKETNSCSVQHSAEGNEIPSCSNSSGGTISRSRLENTVGIPQRQGKITSYCSKPLGQNQRKKIDEQLLKFIVKDYRPFNIVDSQGFQKFVHMLNAQYEIPSRKTLAYSLLNSLYDEVYDKVKIEINAASYICITTDGWTSVNNENYYTITAHFINEDCNLKSYLISSLKFTGRHSAENIAEKIIAELKQWDMDKKIAHI